MNINIRRSPLSGGKGWLLVIALIVAIDITAPEGETLSAACWRSLKKQPVPVIAAIVVTALHLIFGEHKKYQRYDLYRALETARNLTDAQKRALAQI